MSAKGRRLAIVVSHPIQYYAPWFRYLASETNLTVKVFYLWDFGVTEQHDPGFKQTVKWDIPLLEGYEHQFVPNISKDAGTHHFGGLDNPTLAEELKAFAPQAVLLFGYNYKTFYQLLWQWDRKRIPLLLRGDSHRLDGRAGLKEWARRQFIALIFQRFDGFLYVGSANKDYYRYHKVPEKKLFFAPHAIDNQRFIAAEQEAQQQAASWRQQLGIEQDQKVILFVGKFEAKKRPLDLLEAYLQAKLPQTVLLYVGSGELEAELRAKAQSHKDIYFAPFQNQSQMPRTYVAADVMVLPSLYGETWGLAVNEAMCMSRSVIVSSKVGCSRDLVKSEENGLIFPAGDVAALAQCLEKALANPARLRAWGKQGRQLLERFSFQQVTQGLITALDQVTRSRSL